MEDLVHTASQSKISAVHVWLGGGVFPNGMRRERKKSKPCYQLSAYQTPQCREMANYSLAVPSCKYWERWADAGQLNSSAVLQLWDLSFLANQLFYCHQTWLFICLSYNCGIPSFPGAWIMDSMPSEAWFVATFSMGASCRHNFRAGGVIIRSMAHTPTRSIMIHQWVILKPGINRDQWKGHQYTVVSGKNLR